MANIIPCDLILGKKTPEARLGAGRFGEVFRAEQKRAGPVALKCIGSLVQFSDELNLHFTLSLRVEGVCKLFGLCVDHRVFGTCFVMKLYVCSLDDEIKRCGPLALHRVVDVGVTLAQTVATLHDPHQVLIADLKPANVLIDEHGRPFLSDFGVSQALETAMLSQGISSSRVSGTVHYMSPEQLGAEDEDGNPLRVTLKSDVWSFGCTLLHMIIGKLPWINQTTGLPMSETKVKTNVITYRRSPKLTSVPASAPPALHELLVACLEPLAADRPAFGGDGGISARLKAVLSELAASAKEYQAKLDTLRFPLEVHFPEVILSYATATDGGQGELWMWKVASALRGVGIATYNGKQNVTAGDWYQKFFGKLPEAKVFIAFLSLEYFKSEACRKEIYAAASHGKVIIPVIIAMPPAGLRQGNTERYFGATEAEASEPENIEKGNVVSMHTNNCLPPPDRGFFQDDFDGNCAKLVEIVRTKLSADTAGAASPPRAPSQTKREDLAAAKERFRHASEAEQQQHAKLAEEMRLHALQAEVKHRASLAKIEKERIAARAEANRKDVLLKREESRAARVRRNEDAEVAIRKAKEEAKAAKAKAAAERELFEMEKAREKQRTKDAAAAVKAKAAAERDLLALKKAREKQKVAEKRAEEAEVQRLARVQAARVRAVENDRKLQARLEAKEISKEENRRKREERSEQREIEKENCRKNCSSFCECMDRNLGVFVDSIGPLECNRTTLLIAVLLVVYLSFTVFGAAIIITAVSLVTPGKIGTTVVDSGLYGIGSSSCFQLLEHPQFHRIDDSVDADLHDSSDLLCKDVITLRKDNAACFLQTPSQDAKNKKRSLCEFALTTPGTLGFARGNAWNRLSVTAYSSHITAFSPSWVTELGTRNGATDPIEGDRKLGAGSVVSIDFWKDTEETTTDIWGDTETYRQRSNEYVENEHAEVCFQPTNGTCQLDSNNFCAAESTWLLVNGLFIMIGYGLIPLALLIGPILTRNTDVLGPILMVVGVNAALCIAHLVSTFLSAWYTFGWVVFTLRSDQYPQGNDQLTASALDETSPCGVMHAWAQVLLWPSFIGSMIFFGAIMIPCVPIGIVCNVVMYARG